MFSDELTLSTFCGFQSLTDQLLRIKAWDSDLEEETSNGTTERGDKNDREDKVDKQGHPQKVQKLIYAAKVFLLLCNIMLWRISFPILTAIVFVFS